MDTAATAARRALTLAVEGSPQAWQAAVYALNLATDTDSHAAWTAMVALALAERNDGRLDAAARWSSAARDWANRRHAGSFAVVV